MKKVRAHHRRMCQRGRSTPPCGAPALAAWGLTSSCLLICRGSLISAHSFTGAMYKCSTSLLSGFGIIVSKAEVRSTNGIILAQTQMVNVVHVDGGFFPQGDLGKLEEFERAGWLQSKMSASKARPCLCRRCVSVVILGHINQ